MPPLRERAEDIPLLVWTFLEQCSTRMGKKITQVPRKTMEALQRHTWPGNVRELRNVIEHAMLFARGDLLSAEMLMLDTGYRPRGQAVARTPANPSEEPFVLPLSGIKLDELEERLVRQALERAGGNKEAAPPRSWASPAIRSGTGSRRWAKRTPARTPDAPAKGGGTGGAPPGTGRGA